MNRQFARIMLLVVAFAFALTATAPTSRLYTGTGATVNLTTALSLPSPTWARWVLVVAETGNASVARTGGSNTSSTIGAPLVAPWGSFFYPSSSPDPGQPNSFATQYDLTNIYVYVANGDKITVVWGE